MKSGISLDKDYVPSGGDYRRFESKISDSHSSNFRRHAKVHSFRDRLKIVFTNARSIRKNFAEFTVLLEDLKPDVFGITESWLREDIDSAEVSHPGYVVYRQDRRDTHNGVGGGVLLYVRDDIVSVEKSQLQGSFVNSVWCELSTNNSKRSRDVITVGVVYRSPNSSDDNDVVLFDSIRKAAKGDVVIMGDFNFPDINWIDGSSSRKGSNFLDVVQDCFLHQHVTFPTRGDNILDLVLSSNPSNVVDLTGLGKLGTSDHDILAFDVVCKVVSSISKEKVPDFSRSDTEAIETLLKGTDWINLFSDMSASQSWICFADKLKVIMENHVPWKNRRRKSSMPHWMNKKVRCAIRQKRRMWKLFRRTKSESLLAKFKIHQLKVECLVSDAKLNFEKSIALKIKDNPKAFFSYVRSKQKVKDAIVSLRAPQADKIVTDSQDLADLLNDYFVSVFTREDTSSIPDFQGAVIGLNWIRSYFRMTLS
ncbi:endonuclease-reverse transcriptase [Apostichopus japonicus]|uniref:Endonuclease-reverse transcriptase n=1 Tax=Stichopus japonicus TaxID=307972 RepID=A0A2G8L3E5_STIJA|nr:endonuclease-reverse transcriptase [Apostichopus japonicus]